jgi:hypothetical protein
VSDKRPLPNEGNVLFYLNEFQYISYRLQGLLPKEPQVGKKVRRIPEKLLKSPSVL